MHSVKTTKTEEMGNFGDGLATSITQEVLAGGCKTHGPLIAGELFGHVIRAVFAAKMLVKASNERRTNKTIPR